MTVNTRVIKIFLARQHADYVPLSDGLRLQVLPTVEYLPRCQKHHFGAFIQDQQILIVWDDDPKHLLKRAEYIERSLLEMIWADDDEEADEKKGGANVSTAEVGSGSDVEDGYGTQEKRPTLLLNPLMVGATLCLLITALGLGWKKLGLEIAVDGNYTRLALLAVVPCQVFVSLFFMQVIIVNLTQCFGPINNLNSNSKFYSGKAPQRLNRNNRELPHVTIQMPVYKEGLVGVIQPTIISLKAAISTYELQGGTANIFINDDGMQLLPEDEAQARRDFYDEHTIGWVARPGHKPNPQNGEKAFLRRGKFKKASNMNYALMVSNKVEERLLTIARHDGWSQAEEYIAYDQCLARVLEEEEGRAWAGGNIRVGDYILLIDSDTRVPADCLLDAASEMEQSPEVGILQFNSGVMQVTDSFFENGYVIVVYLAHSINITNHLYLVLLSSPTSSTPLSVSPSPWAMSPLLSATTPCSAGPPSNKSPTTTKTATRNSGPNPTYRKISTCRSVSKSTNISSATPLTPEMASKKVSLSLSTTSLRVGKNTLMDVMNFSSTLSASGSRVVRSRNFSESF